MKKRILSTPPLIYGLILLLFFEVIFTRRYIGTDYIFGDLGDGRLAVVILEHWYKFFCGREAFSYLPIFYPSQNLLAYTDLFLGEGMLYSLYRLIFSNMYLAYKYTMLTIQFAGAVALLYYLNKMLRIRLGWSLLGVIAFSFSSAMTIKFVHAQLCIINILPFLCISLTLFRRSFLYAKKRLFLYGFFAILAFDGILYTSWYITFFLCLFALIFAVVYLIINLAAYRDRLNELFRLAAARIVTLAALLILLALSFIPFLMIYLPGLSEFGDFDYDFALQFLPTVLGLVNQSSKAFVWGFINERLIGSTVHETYMGFSLPVLLMFIAVAAYLLFHRKSAQEKSRASVLWVALLLSVVVGLALCVRLGDHSLWRFVFELVPGGSAIRFPGRWLYFLHFPVAILIAHYCDHIILPSSFLQSCIIGLLVLLIFASENVHGGLEGNYYAYEHAAEMSEYPAPPEGCAVFFLTGFNPEKNKVMQWMDAFELATIHSVPTINGYSGQFPAGFEDCMSMDAETYQKGIDSWIDSHGLEGVWYLDVRDKVWHPYNAE